MVDSGGSAGPGRNAGISAVSFGSSAALGGTRMRRATFLLVTVAGLSAGELASRLRTTDPPVIARVTNDQLALDPRTLSPADTKDLVGAFRQAVE